MVFSYSRDPFCCFTTSMDLATFWDCHRRAFAHFGGVPGTIVYDRTKTVIKRHVAPRVAVPLHPEAAAFADHYGFTIDVLAAYRPTGKGRVERQVNIVRDHVARRSQLRHRSPSWTARSPAGCRSAAARSTAPTARSSPSAPKPTGPRCDRCRSSRIWSPRSICAGSARTAWSRFEASAIGAGPPGPARAAGPAADPPRPAGWGPGQSSTRWPSTAAAGWPPIPAPPAAAPGSSTRPTGTGCPTATPAPPPSNTSRPARRPTGLTPLEPLAALLTRRHADLSVAARPLADYAHLPPLADPKEGR